MPDLPVGTIFSAYLAKPCTYRDRNRMSRETDMPIPRDTVDEDHQALSVAFSEGAALCTVLGIDGSFSRRNGAQLAILPGGDVIGSLADGCLEQQLASDCRGLAEPVVKRYGSGSPVIDFRLPCGGGLDILIDPAPDRAACAAVLHDLEQRQPGTLPLPSVADGRTRSYIPRLRIVALGEGPELAALDALARTAGFDILATEKRKLALGRPAGLLAVDEWTAAVLLFHDHEWEFPLLDEALSGKAFYIGAQGGMQARTARVDRLRASGHTERSLDRITSPIGAPSGSRTPHALALAVLAEIAHEYERLRPVF